PRARPSPPGGAPRPRAPPRLDLPVLQQSRQLLEPRRRMLRENLDETLATRRPAQPAKRLENRQIRFAGTVLIDALPAPDGPPVGVTDLRQEQFHQGGLADPQLSGHEHELPLSLHRAPQERMQTSELGLSAHQRGRRRRGHGGTRGAGGGRGGHGPDESESSPVGRLDISRRARRVSERFAQIANAARQRRVAHDRVAPDRGEQLRFRDQPRAVLDEVSQDGECTRRQRESPRTAPRPLVLELQANRWTVVRAHVASGGGESQSTTRAPGAEGEETTRAARNRRSRARRRWT